MQDRASPNWDERPAGARPELLVLHYTGMRSAAEALDRLCDPASRVSAHYLIDEDGAVTALVPEARRAWHAGRSWWRGRPGLNDISIGIELVNPGHEWGYRPFPEAQMASLADLARAIIRRWAMPAWQVVGHSDIAPDRKEDPGELFDWAWLARRGVGVWPASPEPPPLPPAEAPAALGSIGYPLEEQGVTLAKATAAFQRRFRPSLVDGELDRETLQRLAAVSDLHRGLATPR